MPRTETDLKKSLKQGLLRVYFLYGDESYLTVQYAHYLAKKTVGKDSLGEFNFHKFDGQDCTPDQILDAAEALPVMAEQSCVLVRNPDVTAAGVSEPLLRLLENPPETCVLIFYTDGMPVDRKKSAKWRNFCAAVEKAGMAVEFPHKTSAELARMLSARAAKLGCQLESDAARTLVEQAGCELSLLLNELDKLCALAEDGKISRQLVEQAGVKNLESSVFDLSRSILQSRYDRAYEILANLKRQREEPVAVLAVLSTAYVDLYRAKTAAEAGVPADTLTADFAYRGKEFRLRNAARDASRISKEALSRCVEILAAADSRMKTASSDKWMALEQTAAKLIALSKGATL